jgi:hypothetical protein
MLVAHDGAYARIRASDSSCNRFSVASWSLRLASSSAISAGVLARPIAFVLLARLTSRIFFRSRSHRRSTASRPRCATTFDTSAEQGAEVLAPDRHEVPHFNAAGAAAVATILSSGNGLKKELLISSPPFHFE